jgi:hypothetical protein
VGATQGVRRVSVCIERQPKDLALIVNHCNDLESSRSLQPLSPFSRLCPLFTMRCHWEWHSREFGSRSPKVGAFAPFGKARRSPGER